MELTKEQVQRVEHYLNVKEVAYIDLRMEILDHIVSDVEHFLSKNYTFENAFTTVKLRWENHFKETSSLYLGLYYSESKIVVKKAVKIFKPFYFLYLVAYILPVAFLKLFPIQVSENTTNIVNVFLFPFSIIMLVYMLFIITSVRKLKVKSTYRFILKTQYTGLILLITGLTIGVFKDDGEVSAVFTGFVSGGCAVVFICHYFYKKHKEAIAKYKISYIWN